MRAILPPIVVAMAVMATNPAAGQGAVPPLADYYSGPDFKFTHLSGVLTFPPLPPSNSKPRYSLRYAVCDFDPRSRLMFAWPKPGFATGIKYPLSPGNCMTASLDSDAYKEDDNAPIIFAQNNQRKDASAYLPDKSQSPSISRTEVPFVQDGKLTVVEFTIRESISPDGQASYFIEWSQGVPAVAIAFHLPEDVLKGVVELLAKQGVKVRMAKAVDVIDNADLVRLGERVREASFIEIRSNEGRPFRGQFSYKPPRGDFVIEPIILLDSDKGVIAMSSYRSIE
jgi:hypothetical protein